VTGCRWQWRGSAAQGSMTQMVGEGEQNIYRVCTRPGGGGSGGGGGDARVGILILLKWLFLFYILCIYFSFFIFFIWLWFLDTCSIIEVIISYPYNK